METAMAFKSHAELAASTAHAAIQDLATCDKTWGIVLFALVVVAIAAVKLVLGVISFIYVYFLRPGKNLRSYGEWAVVTGATDGIGKAYSVELAKKGLNVVLVSRTQAKLDACAAELRAAHGVQVATCAADLCKLNAAGVAIIEAALHGLEVGILVNNAGMSYSNPMLLEEVDSQTDIDLITINAVAPTLLAKVVLPGMKARGRGVIVNVGSGNGLLPSVPLLSSYAGTKAYINQFSRSLDVEASTDGVRVQDQLPLFVATKMSKIKRARLDAPTPEVWAKAAVRQIGYGNSMSPYWYHGLTLAVITTLAPTSAVVRYVHNLHLRFRAAALRRIAREDAAAAAQALQGEGKKVK